MGKINIPTTFNIDIEFETAPFHVRMFAWIIDFVLLVFYMIIAYNIYDAVADKNDFSAGNAYDRWSIDLLIMLPVVSYHLLCELFWNGQSIGKRLLGLRVVNDNGGKASPGQYIIRWLLRSADISIPIIVIALLLGIVWILKALWITSLMFIADVILMAVHKAAKRLGDLAAGTMLIKTNPKGNLEDTIFMEVADSYVPVFPQVMRLSDRDVNTIKGILDSGRKMGHYQMVESASERVKNVLAIESSMPAFDFLDTLLKDYNYISTKN
ncbi:MAG: RDD family protein [Chitinophagaceae bacterium]|nr:RDD family protein [Chitinophagaceae bacterium]